jgi:hypothetical protein
MRHLIRAVFASSAGALALAFSSSALAAMNPRLDIGTSTQKGASSLALEARLGQTDDWLGRLQVYIPTGYKLNAPAGGATVGTAQVQALGTQVGPNLAFKMTGTVKAIGTTDPAITSYNTSCDTSTHLGAWIVNVIGGDDNWSFPIFVDQTAGTETQFGAYKLVACFGPQEPGGSNPNANKFMTMSLALGGFAAPTRAGDYRWHSLWTPFTGTTGSTLNQPATVEAQSTVHIANSLLTIGAKKAGKHVLLTGKLVVGGEAMDGIVVQVKHGVTMTKLVSMGNVKTNSGGVWISKATFKHPSYFQAGATIGKQELGAGACVAAFGFPCLDATVGGTGVVSRLIRVR